LIELSTSLSNKILRKGDVFSIYVDLHNISEKPVVISDMKIVSPVGFIPLSKDKEKQKSLWKSLWNRITGPSEQNIPIVNASMSQLTQQYELNWNPTPVTPIVRPGEATTTTGPRIITIQPGDNYRENFIIKIGSRVGLRPRPDTYTISVEVVYSGDEGKTLHKQLSIELSIFPTVVGILLGFIVGFGGQELFEQITGIRFGANSTSTA
jgi:hypothetical protein